MSVRVYQPQVSATAEDLQLTTAAAQHVATVLRLRVGASIIIFDGSGMEFHSEITRIAKQQVFVTIKQRQSVNRESPLNVHLGQAIAKGERMDWVIQKAVELGVTTITPLITQHTVVHLPPERFTKKVEHWQRIATSACEQCGRNIVPIIHIPQQFSQWLTVAATHKWMLHPGASQQPLWHQIIALSEAVALLIGPEGGFSEMEIHSATQHHWQILRLGPRILRTETAALAALAMLQAQWGDFK